MPHLPGFILLSLYTGGRPAEVLGIRWRDIRLGADPQIIYATVKGRNLEPRSGGVELHQKVTVWLNIRPRIDDFVLHDAHGCPWNLSRDVRNLFDRNWQKLL